MLSVLHMGLPVGVTLVGGGRASVRVWAPAVDPEGRLDVVVVGRHGRSRPHALRAERDGYFVTTVADVRPGDRYGFRIDGGPLLADPASRYQPEGPFGPSSVVDPRDFAWTDAGWRGCTLDGQVMYELHVGTFTPEGTWNAARAKLSLLADLGIGVIEMMPVAEFPGRFGWGYDGVSLFAPTRLYGAPDDLRRFVDAAHAAGMGVILDVVYNHFGPEGSVLGRFSPFYESKRHGTEWGPGYNYDGTHAGPVRDLVTANAAYWIEEYHFDGLRLDATQNIEDDSSSHILCAIADAVRLAAPGRDTIVVAEDERQQARVVRPKQRGGYGLDAVWNDDFHHSARVALTGLREAYYLDYRGAPQEIVSALKQGFLYQGQRYAWQRQRRGTPALDLNPRQLVAFLENHDQVANGAAGRRLHELACPGKLRAMTAVMLLGPATPLLFQGEEFRSRAPFTYFADHEEQLGVAVEKGRRGFMSQFPSTASRLERLVPAPGLRQTFEACKIDWEDRERNGCTLAMYGDLIALRRKDATFAGRTRRPVDGAVLAPEAFVIRFFGAREDGAADRLLLVNLGAELQLASTPEPLVAPPDRAGWRLLWSSEDPAYGGAGTPPIDECGAYTLPGASAVVLEPGMEATS